MGIERIRKPRYEAKCDSCGKAEKKEANTPHGYCFDLEKRGWMFVMHYRNFYLYCSNCKSNYSPSTGQRLEK